MRICIFCLDIALLVMSGQQSTGGTSCRMAKTPPNAGKQGPLKATIPISSVIKHPNNVGNETSPVRGTSISPLFSWRNRTSPEHASGQRSPGSSCNKVKSKYSGVPSDVMRRTASLDTIYLKGHWPKDQLYWGNMGILHIDKATQTEESDWTDIKKFQCILETEDKNVLRPKIRGNTAAGRHMSPGEHTLNSSSQTLASCIFTPNLKIVQSGSVKPIPKSSMRSSVESLNQEIERIVLRTGSEGLPSDRYEFRQATPEGHRAPLAEMLRFSRSRSVNTQTPQEFSHSSGDSHGSSPDNEGNKLGTSPQINRFLAREPPDGCEKVRLKSSNDKTNILLEHAPQPSTFKLRPSLGSAFKILQPALSPSEEQAEPLPQSEPGSE
ncbi:protein FAM117B-like isoform X2 [Anthonomus grandis grandis]|uniref:protein FAM117B-like isoform X2 n=1 Tax=Anthonomus grandis grandis TaxID=2921223 RepID=UPI00216554F8|nr:protein FAM117B-like isoform X2 [Anthonomus grandis grandis]